MNTKEWMARVEKLVNNAYGIEPSQKIELLKANALIAVAAALADVAEAIRANK